MANFKKLNLSRSKVGEDLLAGKDLVGAEQVQASPSRGDPRQLQEHALVEGRASGRPKQGGVPNGRFCSSIPSPPDPL